MAGPDEMTTASLPLTTAAPPLENDDLLSEILVRLPPLPSSLTRASAVCTQWRRLLSDPAFRHRFRIHHRRSPPLIGFIEGFQGIAIQPTLDAPDRLPGGHFSLKIDRPHMTLGWRHGLALLFRSDPLQVLVWDPAAGALHRLSIPPELTVEFHPLRNPICGAVLRAAGGDVDHFQVVLLGNSGGKQHRRVHASVYSSETGVWGDVASTPLPPGAVVLHVEPAVLAGNCLHWFIFRAEGNILEFDLDRQSLAVTPVPECVFTGSGTTGNFRALMVIRAEGGGMGFLIVSDFTAHVWRKVTDPDGVASWVRERTIELDKFFPPNSEKEFLSIVGYADVNNVLFVRTAVGVFMLHLESLQIKRISETNSYSRIHPFELVYTPGIGGGHDGAKVVKHRGLTRWTQYIRRLFS